MNDLFYLLRTPSATPECEWNASPDFTFGLGVSRPSGLEPTNSTGIRPFYKAMPLTQKWCRFYVRVDIAATVAATPLQLDEIVLVFGARHLIPTGGIRTVMLLSFLHCPRVGRANTSPGRVGSGWSSRLGKQVNDFNVDCPIVQKFDELATHLFRGG